MIWTTEKPTKPGWYWWRDPYKNNRAPEVCRVMDRKGQLIAYFNDDSIYLTEFTQPCEWAGPIPEPEEQP